VNYDDDTALDRAILALPLEPVPEGLRAAILSAVAVRPAPILTRWEMLGVGIILALGTWLSLLLIASPVASGPWISAGLVALGRFITSPSTLTWLAVGMGAALCLTLGNIPTRRASRIAMS